MCFTPFPGIFISMIQRLILTITIVFFGSIVSAQEIGHTTFTFVDQARNGREIETEIYYPAITAGDDTPIAEGTFPIIALGHGFLMNTDAYENYWQALVPQGYILALPTTEGSISPSHDDFGQDLRFLITAIQNTGVGSVVPASSVASTSAIMGHSMGGGSSFLATENNADVTTMVTFAAANTNPSAIDAALQVAVPTLLFSGENDCVTPPAEHQDLMYDNTSADYKTQVTINGGGHCFFANDNFNCSFGEGFCSPNPTITRPEQQDVTQTFLQPWLAYYLKNDCEKGQEFQDSLTTSSRIQYQQSLPITCTVDIDSEWSATSGVHMYPNPVVSNMVIESTIEPIYNVTLYNMMMQSIGTYTFPGTKTANIDLSTLSGGMYFIRCNEGGVKWIMKANQTE